MARIVSVGFEIESQPVPGEVAIPREVADFLGIKVADSIEMSVLCEGLRVEVSGPVQFAADRGQRDLGSPEGWNDCPGRSDGGSTHQSASRQRRT
jgi:hypothetical protein